MKQKMSESVYLDYNATTPLEPEVLTSISDALKKAWGNPSSSHETGVAAKKIIDESREHVANVIGALSKDIIFTSGGTESNNLVITSAVKHFTKLQEISSVKPKTKPHFITSNIEHDSISLVLQHLEEEGIAEVTYVDVCKSTGRVQVEDVISAIRHNTILVTIMMANNETGIIQPICEIGERLSIINRETKRTHSILFHTDAAQTIGKIKVDVNHLDVDYLTIVGQKFYGPRIGALYVRNIGNNNGKFSAPFYPMFYGGGQERNYRPGTENTGMISGLGKAAQLIVNDQQKYEMHMRQIRDYLEQQLQDTFGDKVQFNGRCKGSDRIPNTCNISLIGQKLQGNLVLSGCCHLEASVGAACHSNTGSRGSPILLAMGISEDVARNAIRLSVGRHTSKCDIDKVVLDLKQAVYQLENND